LEKSIRIRFRWSFVFEDDVIFIDNWKNILQKFIDDEKTDSIPYRMFTEDHNDTVNFYKEMTRWCTGGYYNKI
tara:strand:- start:69 stop:287 length:219 start_codon:yes stop_codon:yes gene_type:complete